MEKYNYSELLKHPKWQKKRLEILQRDGFKCRICKDEERTLHIHHNSYSTTGKPWDIISDELITVCELCHQSIEIRKSLKSKIKRNFSNKDLWYKDAVYLKGVNDSCLVGIFKTTDSNINIHIYTEGEINISFGIRSESIKDLFNLLKD